MKVKGQSTGIWQRKICFRLYNKQKRYKSSSPLLNGAIDFLNGKIFFYSTLKGRYKTFFLCCKITAVH